MMRLGAVGFGLELLDLVHCFSVAYHRRPFVLFVLSVFPVGVVGFLAGSSLCSFDCSFCQCQVLVPPWCFQPPWIFHGDGVVGCFVDVLGNVGDGTEGILGSLED